MRYIDRCWDWGPGLGNTPDGKNAAGVIPPSAVIVAEFSIGDPSRLFGRLGAGV